MKRFFKIFFLCCFFANSSRGQNDSSLLFSINKIYYSNVETFDDSLQFIFSKSLSCNFSKINLSGSGSQNYNLSFVNDEFEDFSSNQLSYTKKIFFISDIPIVRTKYLLGSNKEQNFSVKHSQAFVNRIVYSINYDKSRTEGYYHHQLSIDDDLSIGMFYLSKKKKYFRGLTYNYQRIVREENGGVISDSLFEKGEFLNNLLYDVNLTEAQNSTKFQRL